MKKLFDDLSYKISKETTRQYSTSFSLGIMALSKSLRNPIYSIYGYVRLADEIVDSFHDYNKPKLLLKFKDETHCAIKDGISLNPIMQSFQETVRKYKIDMSLIDQFLRSMEMDLDKLEYNSDLYKEYILGSAEVVGLMCLQVFLNGDKKKYEELKPFAMKLGSAFQKVNFLRDIKEDYYQLGRSYFPNLDMNIFDNTVKSFIEKEIEDEFIISLQGIRQLPTSSRFGVYLAYKYFVRLFAKIKRSSASEILSERIRISNGSKMSLMMTSYVKYKTSFL